MAATTCVVTSLSFSPSLKSRPHISPNFFISISASNPHLKPSSLKISPRKYKSSKHVFGGPMVFCLADDHSQAEQSSVSNHSTQEAIIDLKLPRRSLLVHFTCNACGERSQKLINRLAYERGTVFVQCSGCLRHHKLVDNLGLVVEYDFREDMSSNSNADEV